MNEFKNYHPIVNFAYFLFVIMFTMFFMHPVCLCISLGAGFVYSIILGGSKSAKFNFLYMLPFLLVCAAANPLFNHQGVTILAYFPSGNPLTLESVLYGIAAAAVIVSVVCWFGCYSKVMTSDKFVYLFGRVIPAMSLVLSMTLRFVPQFARQIKNVARGQQCLGKSVDEGTVVQRAKNGIKIFSIMITWALENAVQTADSMKSRGYGLPGRTAFSIYKFDKRDCAVLLFICACSIYVFAGWMWGNMRFDYFPAMSAIESTAYQLSLYVVYALLCMLPVIIEITEEIRWKYLRYKI